MANNEGHKSVEKPKCRWREDSGVTGSNVDKDSKGQRKLALSGGGELRPAVEEHSPE